MIIKNCLNCEKQILVKPSHEKKGWGKYCSRECMYIGMKNGNIFKCNNCNKEVYRSLREINRSKDNYFFCSKSCKISFFNKKRIGENHPSYKDGSSSYRTKALNVYSHKCSNKNCEIEKAGINIPSSLYEVDHINENHKDNRIENLQVLCLWCHRKKTLGIL